MHEIQVSTSSVHRSIAGAAKLRRSLVPTRYVLAKRPGWVFPVSGKELALSNETEEMGFLLLYICTYFY